MIDFNSAGSQADTLLPGPWEQMPGQAPAVGLDFNPTPAEQAAKILNFPAKPRTVEAGTDLIVIRQELEARAEEVCHLLLPAGKLKGAEYEVGSVNGEPGKSLKINIQSGVWSDFATGEKGDLIDLWQKCRNQNFRDAISDIKDFLGKTDTGTPAERAERLAEIAKQRAERVAKKQAEQSAAADRARKYLASLPAATDANGYLTRKGVKACPGLKANGNLLVVPVLSPDDDRPMSVQKIMPVKPADGSRDKNFLKDGRTNGGSFAIKGDGGTVYIVEGLATGLTIHEATGGTVIVAFNAGNLESVAVMVRGRYPDRTIIVCGDNDAKGGKNTGVEAAVGAALAVNGLVAVPPAEPGSSVDWNDIHLTQGLEAVRSGILAARSPEPAPGPEPEQPGPATAAVEDWPTVVSFDSSDAPAIPPEVITEPLRVFCLELARATQAPFEICVFATIGAVSAVTQGLYRVMVRPDYFEPLCLYLLAALPPGTRKSPVVSAAKKPLLDWEAEQWRRMGPEIKRLRSEHETKVKTIERERSRATPETLSEVVRKIQLMEAELPKVPEIPRLLVDDVTPEELAVRMAKNGERIAIVEAEAGIFEVLTGLYSNGKANLNLLLKAWSEEGVTVDRRSADTIRLRHPLLTLALIVQPEVLRDIAKKPGFRGKGVLGRFVYCLPKSGLGSRRVVTAPINQAVAARYRAMILNILETPVAKDEHGEPCPHELRLSDGAYRAWVAFAEYVEGELRDGGTFENIRDWAGKLPGQAVRLAGVFHVASELEPARTPIPETTMRQAVELAAVLADHALAAFAEMGADPAIECAKRIWKWIADTRPTRFTARDSHQAVKGSYPKADEVAAGLRVLEDRAYIRPVEGQGRPGPGRKPSPVFEINPYARNSHNSHNRD